MKKVVLTIGLCLATVASFGQKKAVSDALKAAKDSKPNFTEARTQIKAALENAETKDDAKTWYTAGQIEDFQFTAENTKQILGQKPDESTMYNALIAIYPYFQKAYELDKKPDAKGKVKPKYTKDMASILKTDLPHYINGGAYFFEQKDYKKSYDFFNQYIDISDGDLMKTIKDKSEATVDSQYIFANFYAAIAASQLNDHNIAIAAMNRATKIDYRRSEMYQYLCEEYKATEDTVNLEKILNEAIALYPKEQYFLLNLVGIYMSKDDNTKAIEFLNTAIQQDPSNAVLYNAAGSVYETGLKDYAKSEEYFQKAIDIEPDNADYLFNLGRIFFNQGVSKLDEANSISDVNKYNEEKENAKKLFRKALPLLEKSYSIDSESSQIKLALSNIYYQLDMGDKYEQMQKAMNE